MSKKRKEEYPFCKIWKPIKPQLYPIIDKTENNPMLDSETLDDTCFFYHSKPGAKFQQNYLITCVNFNQNKKS